MTHKSQEQLQYIKTTNAKQKQNNKIQMVLFSRKSCFSHISISQLDVEDFQ